jgi:hypothetical protein
MVLGGGRLELGVVEDLEKAGAVSEEEDDSRQQDAEAEEGEEFHVGWNVPTLGLPFYSVKPFD